MTRRDLAGWSPFLAIPFGWRIGIITYVLLYEWFFPFVATMGSSDADALLLSRVLMRFVHVLLICWPLVFYRREYGFLHPLILPVLFSTLKEIAKFPMALFMPFDFPLFSFDVTSLSSALSIRGLSDSELAWMRLEYEAVQALALICYYVGYFAFRRARLAKIRFYPPRHLASISFAATMTCVLVAAFFIQVYGGGLSKHLVAMRSGRIEQFEGLGQFLQIAAFAILPVLVWFTHIRRPFLNPWWLTALAAATLAAILTTGSRSSFIYPLIILTFLWWRKAGRVLIGPSLALVLVAIAVVGGFGAIRQDYGSHTIDTSVFSFDALADNVIRAQAEFKSRRAEEADFAAFVGARNGSLWGRTYVGGAAFFIPRAVWRDKPRSADTYNMAVNFAGRSIENYDSGRIWGIPVNAVSEAYWNFHLPGVVVVFLLLGCFHRCLSVLVLHNKGVPAVLVVAIWISINFSGTSLSFVNTMRDIIMLGGFYYLLGIWRPHVFLPYQARRRLQTVPSQLGAHVEGRSWRRV